MKFPNYEDYAFEDMEPIPYLEPYRRSLDPPKVPGVMSDSQMMIFHALKDLLRPKNIRRVPLPQNEPERRKFHSPPYYSPLEVLNVDNQPYS